MTGFCRPSLSTLIKTETEAVPNTSPSLWLAQARASCSELHFDLANLRCCKIPMLLKKIESVVIFVANIDEAAAWYAELFQTEIRRENSQYAFIKTPGGLLGFHPLDSKCPGGPGGTTVYWEVEDLQETIKALEKRGAVLYRGPISTSFGARAAMLLDPFGCTIGLNQSTEQSLHALASDDRAG